MTIVLPEQPLRYVQSIVRIDANQMSVEGSVMDFRQRNAVRYQWLSEPLVPVGDDVGGVQKQRLGQSRQSAAAVIGGDNGLAERRLVQALLDRPQGVTPFERVFRWLQRLFIGYAKRDARP